jgi:aryl-alcohol dehydrogenase-like predicted oxidoreductase
MDNRTFGRLGWSVSEVGYGMWGVGAGPGGWQGADDRESLEALQLSVELGCNFFDTAWIYGRGHSEQLLGRLLKDNPDRRLYAATKVPPKDRAFPSTRASLLSEVFPYDYVAEYIDKSLANLGVDRLDLLQYHVWEDSWVDNDEWLASIERIRSAGLAEGIGISINRWEPWNGVRAVESGLIDSVQVIYNIFDQSPEDELFPACRAHNVAVIARVPFDEGTLTGAITRDTTFPADDWRASYFVPENLEASVTKVEALQADLPPDANLADIALRFILHNPDVATVIPGMRRTEHVRRNIASSDGQPLPDELMTALRTHRWDREPTEWSQ